MRAQMTWTCGVCGIEYPEGKPAGGLTPEVREAVNRARAARGEATLERGPGYKDPPLGCVECGAKKPA